MDEDGMHRLQTALNGHAQSALVEKEYIDKDYRDTFSHFHSKRFVTPPSRCIRIHFLRGLNAAEQLEDPKRLKEVYLGYSVIRPTRPNCIGRTLLKSVCRSDPNAAVCKAPESVFVRGVRLTFDGFPFISQDCDATVCAQSALWMLIRYFSNRYSEYPERRPFEVTRLAEPHVGERLYPSHGHLCETETDIRGNYLGCNPQRVRAQRLNRGPLPRLFSP